MSRLMIETSTAQPATPAGAHVFFLTTQSHTAAMFVLPYARYLKSKGYTVTIGCSPEKATDGQSYIDIVIEAGFPILEVPIAREIHLLKDYKALQYTLKLLNIHQFDLVHTHNSKAGIIGRWAAFLNRRSVVVHTNHGLAIFKSNLVTFHRSLLFWMIESITSRVSDCIMTVSMTEFCKTRRYHIAYPPRLQNVDQGVDTRFFSPDKATQVQDSERISRLRQLVSERPVIGSVSRLVKEKGIDCLLDAVAHIVQEIPHLAVLVVGDGPERAALKQQAHQRGIQDNVIFVGAITNREEIRQLYQLLDVFVLPSRWESFGVVYAEAMAMQIPVVGTAIAPITTVVADGETGFLAELNHPEAFADVILKLLHNSTLRATMGKAARQRVLDLWDEQLTFRRMEEIYSALLNKRNRRLVS